MYDYCLPECQESEFWFDVLVMTQQQICGRSIGQSACPDKFTYKTGGTYVQD